MSTFAQAFEVDDDARTRVEAVSRLLTGRAVLGAGLTFVLSSGLDWDGLEGFGRIAAATGADILNLDYRRNAVGPGGAPVLDHVDIVMVRRRVGYAYTRCRLSVPRGGEHAVLVPRTGAAFHFRVEPNEVVQVQGRARDVAAGVARADRRLAALMIETGDACAPGRT